MVMTNNNHKNTECGYAEQLVSYLYDETSGAEKSAFEAHIKSCAECAGELEAFSGVHFSINDWKAMEFDRLPTPVFEIPYEKKEISNSVEGKTGSWLSALGEFFSLSPRALSLATASVAVLVVCFGLFIFVSRSSQNRNDISQTGNTPQKSVTPPTVENKNTDKNVPTENVPNVAPDAPQQPDVAAPIEQNQKNTRVVKASTNNQRRTQVKENTPKTNDVKSDNKKTKAAPGVIEDEDEDDTLRLAELFEEVGTDE